MPTARSGRRCRSGAAPTSSGPGACCSRSPICLKFVFKEPVIPAGANKGVFLLAPLVTCVLALAAWAVIPVNAGWVIADINVGILYIFAISSLMVYGVIMAGWASNSKYPFLGRAALGGADGVLRGLDRLRHHHRAAVRRLAELCRHRRGAETAEAGACSAGTGCRCCRCSSCSSSRRWPRPTGRRSIWSRRNPNWSPASWSNTARRPT